MLPDQGHGGEHDKAVKTPVAAWRSKTPRGANAEASNQYTAFQGNKGNKGARGNEGGKRPQVTPER